ncbi:MAG TPA: VC0807 family protein [Streptosporangiaceae bacterium]|jgi:hypothetical protein
MTMAANPALRPQAFLGPLLGDLVAPVAVYYLAQALGASPLTAMLLAGAACLPRLVLELIRRHRLDGLGTAVLIGFVLGAALTLSTGDVRALAVKDAIWPLAGFVVIAGSCLRGKPVTFYMFRPLLTQGRAENRPMWDEVWRTGTPFRHCLRVLAAIWAVLLLLATVAEVIAAVRLPLSQAGAVPGLVTIVTVPLLLASTALYGKRTGLGIRASLDQAGSR